MIAGLERDQRRVERDEQEQERQADDAGDEQRHAVEDVVALVLERRGHAADLGVDAGAAERSAGTRSSRSRWTRSSTDASCGEPFGITVRSAASPASLMRGGATKATSRLAAQLLRERVDLRLAGRVRQVGGDHERAVGAGPEALGVAGRRPGGSSCSAGRCRRRGSRGACRARGPPARAGPAVAAIAAVHGRRWTAWLQRARERPLAARLLRQAAAEERAAAGGRPSGRGRRAARAAA